MDHLNTIIVIRDFIGKLLSMHIALKTVGFKYGRLICKQKPASRLGVLKGNHLGHIFRSDVGYTYWDIHTEKSLILPERNIAQRNSTMFL